MSLKHRVELGAYLAAGALARGLPLATAQRGAAALARAYFRARPERVRWMLANLRIAYPDRSPEERAEIGRASCVHFAWNLLDVARSERWDDRELLAHVGFDGLDLLRQALARGRGAIVLSGHIGCFELGIGTLPLVLPEPPFAALARPLRNPYLWRRILAVRAGRGGEIIPHKDVAARAMLRALRAGRPVFVLNDQYARRSRGVFAPLFGVRCSTAAGVATIALRTGAPVLSVYLERDAPDHHMVHFRPPLEDFTPSGDRQKDVETLTARYNEAIEELIRIHPEQWMWGHRRFRHSPDLEESPYS